jgi:hypothetical protein
MTQPTDSLLQLAKAIEKLADAIYSHEITMSEIKSIVENRLNP